MRTLPRSNHPATGTTGPVRRRCGRSSLRRVTFIPTEKPPPKPRWDLTSEEWRLLVITFVGGLGSIVVGAGALGVAVALARFFGPGPRWALLVTTVLSVGATVASVQTLIRQQGPYGRPSGVRKAAVLLGLSAFGSTLFLLTWIGLAAGVH
jgi:hypothetical protein